MRGGRATPFPSNALPALSSFELQQNSLPSQNIPKNHSPSKPQRPSSRHKTNICVILRVHLQTATASSNAHSCSFVILSSCNPRSQNHTFKLILDSSWYGVVCLGSFFTLAQTCLSSHCDASLCHATFSFVFKDSDSKVLQVATTFANRLRVQLFLIPSVLQILCKCPISSSKSCKCTWRFFMQLAAPWIRLAISSPWFAFLSLSGRHNL